MEAFKVFDKSGDGYILAAEFFYIISKLNDDEKITDIIEKIDNVNLIFNLIYFY